MNKFNAATKEGPSNTVTDVWITPKWVIDKLGGWEVFDLDPCGWYHPEKEDLIVRTAKNTFSDTLGGDGLIWKWFGNVFLNFPYSDAKSWMSKMKEHGEGIVLCFLRSDTKWFQDNVRYATGINMLKGRIKFLDKDGIERGNGNAASCLIAYGDENFQRIKNFEGIVTKIIK